MAVITLNPTTSLPGASIGVAGTGFGNRRICTIKVDGISIKSIRSGKAGRFNTTVIAPPTAGIHNISASSTIGSATAVLTVQAPTPPPPIDPAPVISNIVISTITQTSANISWGVSENAQGWIEYGETTAYGSETVHEFSFNYSHHAQTISGLTAGKAYHFRIVAVDSAAQIVKSSDQSFTTLLISPPPPPPSQTPSNIYGPGVGADEKGNLWIGMNSSGETVKREVGIRWLSVGGHMTSYAFNQRFGAGYSMGSANQVELSLYKCGTNGLPEGNPLAQTSFNPANITTAAEIKTPILWSADIPTGLVCIMHRNLAPVGNFISANFLHNTSVDSPRQPAFPDDSLAVLYKDEVSALSVNSTHTPVFDVTFSDGRHEGQAYYERYVDTEEAIIGATSSCRERFTPKLEKRIKAVGFRVLRRTATSLQISLGGVTSTVDISGITPEKTSDNRVFTGHKWIKVPLTVTLPANVEQSCVIKPVGGEIRVSPLRSVDEWGSRNFMDGISEKSINGGTWQAFYPYDDGDLQIYFELDTTTSVTRPFAAPVTTSTVTVPSTITTGSAFNAWVIGKSSSIIQFPANAIYDLDAGFKFESLHDIILNLNGATLKVKGAGNTPNSSPFVLRACKNITINGPATVIGNNPNTTTVFVSGNENSHVLALSGWYGLAPSSYIEITGITASNIYGDFAYLEGNNIEGNRAPSHHVWVHGNKGTYIGRNAISLINVTDVWESDNEFDKVGMDIIDIEPNFGAEQIRRVISHGDKVGSYGHMTAFVGYLVNSWGVDAASVVEDITIEDHVVAGNPSGGYAGSGIRALHVQFTDHIDTRRVTIQRLSTTRAAPGPTMRFTSVDGVTCHANNQPLSSGTQVAVFSGCTNVIYP